MPETCTCGAQLPPDAVFCHKCGKPQRELVEVETVEPVAAPVTASPPAPVMEAPIELKPVTFHNREAVRTARLAAVLATFLFFLWFFAWIGAGFFAVSVYQRRTKRALDTGSCLRLGWLTGLLAFAIPAVLSIAMILMLHASGNMGTLHAIMQSVKDPQYQKSAQQFWEIMQSPPELLAAYLQCFVLITFFCMAGGLLGALVGRLANPRPSGGNTV